MSTLIPLAGGPVISRVIMTAALISLALVHIRGVRMGSRLSNLFTVAKRPPDSSATLAED